MCNSTNDKNGHRSIYYVQRIFRIIKKEYLVGKGEISTINIKPHYLKKICNSINLARTIKVAIDCGNGASSVCAKELFSKIGVKVESLFCDVDGSFPNHHPDPSKPENLADLQKILSTGDSE